MKKFLSLVLALVMTMSLVTISAGAKDFTDDSTITYSEAVDVISEIGVVDGYTDGSFNPGATLTRGAAAKIICNLILGPTTASALSADAAPYKDVPTSNTFAGYIAYCAQQGIISGYADGTFRPAATLTSYAFMKMLLGALGYDAEIEGYVGANWSIQVAKQALAIGLDDGLETEFVGTKPVTREEACLYAFNMLQATMVEYDSKTTVNVNGATVTVAGDKAKEVAQGSYKDNMGKVNLQFAEKYFDKLVKIETTDDFARPATKWTWKGVKVGTYADKADATYTADVKLGTIYADLGMSDKDEKAPLYVDGVQAAFYANVKKGNDTKVSDLNADSVKENEIGNGTLVEAFLDTDTNNVTIVAINTYVAEVNKVVAATASKDAYITLSALNGAPVPTGWSTADEYKTTGFKSGDIVLFTFAAGDIQSVKLAESVDGTATKLVSTKSLNLGDTTYKYSRQYGVKYGESNMTVDSEYTVYLDEYGYAIYVEESEYNIADYALLVAIDNATHSGQFASDRVKLLTYEGKKKVVNTTKDYNGTGLTPGAEGTGDIVIAKEASNGEYRVKAVSGNRGTETATAATIVNGNANLQLTLTGAQTATTYQANSKTLFVVKTAANTYKTYTGHNSVPSITGTNGSSVPVSFYCRSNKMITIAFIDATQAGTQIVYTNNDVIFFAKESASKHTSVSDNDYYTYNAVVNGKIVEGVKVDDRFTLDTTPNVSGEFSANTVYFAPQYDDDVIDHMSTGSNQGTAVGTEALDGDYTIELKNVDGTTSSRTFAVADDCKVFFIDDDGVITEGSIGSVRKTDDAVNYVTDSTTGELTYLFIQQYFSNKETSGGNQRVSGMTVNPAGTQVTVTSTVGITSATVTLSQLRDNGYVVVGSFNVAITNGTGTATLPTASGNTYMVSCGSLNPVYFVAQ